MRRMKLLPAAIIITLCLLPVPGPPAASAQEPTTDEARLRHLKTVLWPKAYREQDVVLLARILHPDFRAIDAEGAVSGKADEIEYIRRHKPSYSSFRFDIERLEIFEGRFAVVSGVGVILNDGKEGKEETRYRSSNHFVKEGGDWRAVSSHVSGVKTVSLGK